MWGWGGAVRDQSVATLGDYLAILRRRAWIVVVATMLTAAGAYLYSSRQPQRFAASAQVLLNQTAGETSGGQLLNAPDAARYDETQARVAVTPVLARRVLVATGARGLTANGLLQEAVITADPSSDILTFRVTDASGSRAETLANAYADQFVAYRRQLDTASLTTALAALNPRLSALTKKLIVATREKSASVSTLQYRVNQLSIQFQNLKSLLAVQGGAATVFNAAESYQQTQPKVARDTLIGVLLGLVAGLGLAFAAEGLETRVRGPEEAASVLGLAMLGRISQLPARLSRNGRLAMLSDQERRFAEPYRRLAVTLKHVNRARGVSKLMVTSAVRAEGKSTTVANLAVACARSGSRVVIVDLDLHNPTLHRLFEISQTPGFAGVAIGEATLEEALVQIPVDPRVTPPGAASTNGHRDAEPAASDEAGTLWVLPAGLPLYDPGEFLQTTPVGQLLDELAESADLVLVDSPPVLPVSDALTISDDVDGVLVLARSKVVSRPAMTELKRQLDGLRTPAIGFAFIGSASEAEYGTYGYGYGYGDQRKRRFSRRPPAPPALPRPVSTPLSDVGGEG
jgi:polysaccharide biosynthesis transport protein